MLLKTAITSFYLFTCSLLKASCDLHTLILAPNCTKQKFRQFKSEIQKKKKKGMLEVFPTAPPLPRGPSAHMVTATGKHIKYFKVQLACMRCLRRFLCISLLLSVNGHFTILTFPPRIRWEGLSLRACSFLNRMPFAINEAVAHP